MVSFSLIHLNLVLCFYSCFACFSHPQGVNYIKCDHQRAVHLFIAAFETNCNFVSFPCASYKEYENGLCADCRNGYGDTCPRLGKGTCYIYYNSF